MLSTPDTRPLPAARRSGPSRLVHLLTPRQRLKYGVLTLIWALLAGYFWTWWLQPEHIVHPAPYWTLTATIFWVVFLQVYFLFFFLRARKPVASLDAIEGARVAMVVTKAPSEPFAVVERTLRAMLAQDYPHDTWLADEDPEPETVRWCAAHGVKISTRRDRPDYHRATWPRRTRCKEGNLAFFYDHYGYDRYDFVAQLDCDHVPQPRYLREMLRPFADPDVGYVSAPSICSANADASWAARSRLYNEAMFHGVFQAGCTAGFAPMCIGSHYAVRTRALREVGGLGPELAEDHSTSLLMNSGGWRGVHAVDAIAYGDGPRTFADMITQEFQWSRSLVTLLLQYTPHYFRTLTWRAKFQFLFSEMWYPLSAVFMALTLAMPVAALVFDIRFANVTYPAFVGHAVPPTLVLIAICYLIRRDELFRPYRAKVISWEKALFPVVQWPWVLWGSAIAVWDRLTGRFVDFRITPKGDGADSRLPMRVVLPYVFLAAVALAPVLLVDGLIDTRGYYLLSLVNAIVYTVIVAVIVIRHMRENGIDWRSSRIATFAQSAAVIVLAMLTGLAIWERGADGLATLAIGMEPFQIVETKFFVSGAGNEPGRMRHVFGIFWD